MKPFFLSTIIFWVSFNANSQILGKLVTTDSVPLSFVNVSLLKMADSSFVESAVTDEKGNFKMENVPPGNYFLQFTRIGYQLKKSPVTQILNEKQMVDVGPQILMQEEKQLSEVTVRTQHTSYQQKQEGIVVNIGNSLLTKGSTAIESLERLPGVTIDRYRNNISLNNKSGAIIMLNGKIMRMSAEQITTFLSGISANDIDKIELLTTPPAGYDAEGSAGIINIVLKKNKKRGTNGTALITGGYGWREKFMSSLNIGHSNEKLNLYGSYSFSHDKTISDFWGVGTEIIPALGGNITFDFRSMTQAVANNHNANIGIDAIVNSKLTIGGNINYNYSNRAGTTSNQGTYIFQPDSLLSFNGNIASKNHWQNMIGSAYAEWKIKEEEKVNASFDYLYYSNNGPSDIQSSFLNKTGNAVSFNTNGQFAPLQKGFSKSEIKVAILKIDYSKQLGKNIKLGTGAKGTFTVNPNISGIESQVDGEWKTRNETLNNTRMKEAIGAVYASADIQIDTSTTLSIGSRYEFYHTIANNLTTNQDTINRKLGQFFPSIFLSKKISSTSELQLSFTRRISRPAYNDLASYVVYNDPLSVFTGNPFLKPGITNNIKLGFNYRNYLLSLLFSRDENAIVQGQVVVGAVKTMVYIAPQNISYQNNISLQAIIPVKIAHWWNMNYSFTGGWRQFRIDYTVVPAIKSYFGYSLTFNQSFQFLKSFSGEISGWYNSTYYIGTSKITGNGVLNMGMKKDLKNNRGALQLSVSDILRTMYGNSYFGYYSRDAFNTQAHVRWNAESTRFPIIKLSYTKTFGSGSQVHKKDNSNEEERGRARGS